ncbi:AIPR family protein, partial [Enterococcus faecalis]|nr:AIPR family protein [Enterococcus faecalis]
MTNIIEKLCDKGILDIEDITSSQPSELFNDFKQIEKQTQDSMKQIIYISYENVDESKKEKYILERLENLINLESYLMESEEFNNLYIIFKNWEQEREALDIFLDNASSASEKKSINAIFSFCQPIYSEIPNKMTLKVDDEGINYLEYEGIECMEAKIFNVSMHELQKLYNILGTSLFQNNVRIGLANRKTGKELKEEFKSYLLTGLYGEHKDDSEEAQNYFGMSESDLLKFNPDIFWYKHNGINIYMNENGSFEFSSDAILLNPQNANVINGAQTLTSFFLAKEEVLKDLSGIVELDKQGLTQAIDEILKNIVVKTIFIKGSSDLTPTITWGLNNQIPITEQDFIGVSGEVEKLNNLLGKYQLKILKTGEIEKIYTGLTPLSFMKLYLIAQEQPGKSKNYNKKNLKIDLSEAV